MKLRYKGKKWEVIYEWGDRVLLLRTTKKGKRKGNWVDRQELDL